MLEPEDSSIVLLSDDIVDVDLGIVPVGAVERRMLLHKLLNSFIPRPCA